MPAQILSFEIPEVNPEVAPANVYIPIVEYIDPRLQMPIRASVLGGYSINGETYLIVQPQSHLLGCQWMAFDCDETAFRLNVSDMLNMGQVS